MKVFIALIALVVGAISAEVATPMYCDSEVCFFVSDDGCRSLETGGPASISTQSQNNLVAQIAAGTWGGLGLGGIYYEGEGVLWEDESPVSFTPSGFSSSQNGFLVINGAGEWSVASFLDRQKYDFVCKVRAAETTSTSVTTTTPTSTTVPTTTTTPTTSTLIPTTTTVSPQTTSFSAVPPNMTEPTTSSTIVPTTSTPLASNTTNSTVTTPMVSGNITSSNWTTTMPLLTTLPMNVTLPNITTAVANHTIPNTPNVTSGNLTTFAPTNVTSMSNITNQTSSSVAPTMAPTVPVTLPTGTKIAGVHPIVSCFANWSQTLVAFSSPSRLPVSYTSPFSDGATEYKSLLVTFSSTVGTCSSVSSHIAFDGNGTSVFSFAAPSQIMKVLSETVYYMCIKDVTSGQEWVVDGAKITVVPLHQDFVSKGLRTLAIQTNMVELMIPSVSTVPFVLTLELYDAYTFAVGLCASETRVTQTPVIADGKLYLVIPSTLSISSVCVIGVSSQLRLDVPLMTPTLTATARVSTIPAGHNLLISLAYASQPLQVFGWISASSNCSSIPSKTTSLFAVAASLNSGEQDYTLAIPSTAPTGHGICVGVANSSSGSASAVAVVRRNNTSVTITPSEASGGYLTIPSGTLQPIAVQDYMSDLTDIDAFLAAYAAIAKPGTPVWLAKNKAQCANGTRIGATTVVADNSVQWGSQAQWSGIPSGSYALCYDSGAGGVWLIVNVLIVDRVTATMASHQRVLVGSNIYTELLTSDTTDNCLTWHLAIAPVATGCRSPSNQLLSATFYQQGNALFGSFGAAPSTFRSGTYMLCRSSDAVLKDASLKAVSLVDLLVQVEESSVIPSNYFPDQYTMTDITHLCGGALSPAPMGVVLPLSSVMWTAIGRVTSRGYNYNGVITASNHSTNAIFVIACPTCPIIAVLPADFQGCVSTSDLLWTESLQYLTVTNTAIASPVGASPHRAGVLFRLILADNTTNIATIDKSKACMQSAAAAYGYSSAVQTVSFIASTSLTVGSKYIACAHAPNNGPWVFAGIASTVASAGTGGSGVVTSMTGIAERIRIPAASNLIVSLTGNFPDTTTNAYSISFAYAGTECNINSASSLVAKTPLTVTSPSTAVGNISLALPELVSGTARVCLHSDDVTIVPIPATAYPTSASSVTFVYPTLKTINHFTSLVIPANASSTYTLVLTDADYTAGQILFIEKNAAGTVNCNASSATMAVVDSNTKTALLYPFSYARPATFGTCVSGRIGDAVRWFPADFTLTTAPSGLSPNSYVLRLWFSNPLNAKLPAFSSFVSNRVATIDNVPTNYTYLIGQLSTTAAVVAPIPQESVEATNARVVQLYQSLVMGGGILSFASTNSDDTLATLSYAAVTNLEGTVIENYGSEAVGTDPITLAPTSQPEDTTDYSTKAFLIFVCIAAPITLGLVGHAFINKMNGGATQSSAPPTSIVSGNEFSPADVNLKPIVTRAEASQAATELSVNRESRAPEDSNVVSSPIPEHPLRNAIGTSKDK